MQEPTIEDQLKAGILAQKDGGAVAAPSISYVKFILEDQNIPENIHPALRSVVFDKELSLTNLRDSEIPWLRRQFQLAEITYKMSRPALACNYTEEIMLSTLPAKQMIKLSRSRDGGFERRQQTTQTVIKRVEGMTSTPVARRVGKLRRLLPGGNQG